MKPNHHYALTASALSLALLAAASASAQPVGQWDFDNSNLVATVGADLTYADGPGGSTELATLYGSTSALGIPAINGTNALVMAFPAAVFPMGYEMPAPVSLT